MRRPLPAPRRWRRLAWLPLGVGLALACAARPDDPVAVVEAYFHSLGDDPVRSLPLLSETFHEQHGLYPITTAEATRRLRGQRPRSPERPAGGGSLDAARVAWLMVQMKPEYRDIAASLRIQPERPRIDDDRARVRVRVDPGNAPVFLQTFALSRNGPDGRWQIDRVRQTGVRPKSRLAAAAAWPSTSHERGKGAR